MSNLFDEFADIYDELETSNSPSINKIIPLYNIMTDTLQPSHFEFEKSLEDEAVELLKVNLQQNIDSKYKTQFRLEHKIATFLDPTFKVLIKEDLSDQILEYAIRHGIAEQESNVILNASIYSYCIVHIINVIKNYSVA